MKLIIGLGNPGSLYVNTRHNMGFKALELLAEREGLSFSEEKKFKCLLAQKNYKGEKVLFAKPLTYMNLSGDSVILLINYYKIPVEDILVVCDDLDSNPGRVRLRADGSSGGHNGLKSIIQNIGTEKFKRIKLGIGRDKNIAVPDYVLGQVKKEDLEVTNEAICQAADAILEFVNDVPFVKIASKYSKKWVFTHFLSVGGKYERIYIFG